MDDLLHMPFDDLRSQMAGARGTRPSVPSSSLARGASRGPAGVQVQRTTSTAANPPAGVLPPPGGAWFMGPELMTRLAQGPGGNFGPFFRAMPEAGLGRPRAPEQASYEQLLLLDRENVKRGVKPSVVSRLQCGRPSAAETAQSCQICLSKLGQANRVTRLPCKHAFCEGCIQEWLRLHHTCPVCRWEFPERDTQTLMDR